MPRTDRRGDVREGGGWERILLEEHPDGEVVLLMPLDRREAGMLLEGLRLLVQVNGGWRARTPLVERARRLRRRLEAARRVRVPGMRKPAPV